MYAYALQSTAIDPLRAVFDWFLAAVWSTLLSALSGALGVRMLDYPFMQRAYLAAVCIGIIGPLVGAFLVHREISMIADTLAHTAFAGVAIGLFLNSVLALELSPIGTAFVVAIVTALLVELLVQRGDVTTDTSLAMVLTGGFALGSVLISATEGGIAVGINAYLFGSLATVSRADVGLLVLMTLLVSAVVAVAYRPLLYVTFDPTAARVAGISVTWFNRLMTVLTALVVVSAMQIMGVILVAALLVIPVATVDGAHSFRRSLVAGVLAAELGAVLGIAIAYQYGLAAGGTIVLTAIGLYVVVLAGGRIDPRGTLTGGPPPGESASPQPNADGGDEDGTQ